MRERGLIFQWFRGRADISSIGEIFRRYRTWARLVARACPVGAYRKLFMSRTVANSACARGRLHACTRAVCRVHVLPKIPSTPTRGPEAPGRRDKNTPRKEGERPDLDKPADIAATLINLLENKLAKNCCLACLISDSSLYSI